MGVLEAPGRFGPGGGPDGGAPLSAGERIYGGLLWLYPSTFRERYRDEMVVLFGDQLRDARDGRAAGGLAATWLRTLIDLLTSAVGEHLRKDRVVAQSLASFEPTRSMRLLGLFGIVGAVLLLWAFISFNPFQDQGVNQVRLITFALAGAAIALAFHRRQALAAPTLALLTTAAVVIAGIWSAAVVILSNGVQSPFIGTFGLIGLFSGIALWVSPAVWAIGMLHTGAAWQGMSRNLRLVTKLGLAILIGSIIGWLGDDRLGLVDSLWGEMWQTIVLAGVAANGIGWLLLGGVLLAGGRGRSRAGGPAPA